MTRFRADLILLGCAVIWGFAFLFQKTAMEHVGPLTFVASRAALAAVVLAPLAYSELRRKGLALDRDILCHGAFCGLLFFSGAAFQQLGLTTATVTNAGFLTALYVILVPFIAWVTLGKLPASVVWPAAAMSFAGTWLLGGGTLGHFSQGDLWIIVCAFFWAGHVVSLSRPTALARPLTLMCVQFATVFALAATGALALETVAFAGVMAATPQILYLGVLAGAITFTAFTYAMRATPAAEAAVIVSLETLFAAIAGYMFLNERLGLVGWLGAALIVSAGLLVQLSPLVSRHLSQASSP
ncbi:MAG TPA: DMT family transporter [Hyphomicrobiaceae bacterium]|nr:DMT family transporter [Hyphomicrobiaceae bacterium]